MTNQMLDLFREKKIQRIRGVEPITSSDSTKQIQITLREGIVQTVPNTEWQDVQQRRNEVHVPNPCLLLLAKSILKMHSIAVNLYRTCYEAK